MKPREVSLNPVPRIAARALTLAAFAASCGENVVDPILPQGAVPFTPPSYYSTWWEMAKSCSGRSGSIESVSWYRVPSDLFMLNGESVSAYWSAGSNQIVLSDKVLDDGQVVRHEMLHALLGEKGHSRPDFLEKCAGYVTCTPQCVAEAGPAPPVPGTIPRVTSSLLEVTMDIAPAPLFSAVNGGYFAVTVRARNPTAGAVFVELPSVGQFQTSFEYSIIGPISKSDRVAVHDSSAALFAAGETKLHVFDFFADNQGTLPRHIYPGLYTVRGMFAGHGSLSQSLQAH